MSHFRPSEATRPIFTDCFENPAPPEMVALRERQFDRGRDFWSGQQLTGQSAAHWLRVRFERTENVGVADEEDEWN